MLTERAARVLEPGQGIDVLGRLRRGSQAVGPRCAQRNGAAQRDVYYHHKGEPQVYRVNRSFPGKPTTRKRVGVAEPGAAGIKWMKLEEEQYPIWNYGLSSDGSRLFVNTSNYVVKRHTIYVFDTESLSRETYYDFEDQPRRRLGAVPGGFDLQRFHDEFLQAGVIPISLIRWEMTGRDDEIRRMR